jgi:hypothetical protein
LQRKGGGRSPPLRRDTAKRTSRHSTKSSAEQCGAVHFHFSALWVDGRRSCPGVADADRLSTTSTQTSW